MRTSVFGLMMVAAVAVMCTGCAQRTMLFNGRDFSGWKLYVHDENVNVHDVWSVRGGLVHCVGRPNGYMRTLAEYSNYKLHVEWRWTEAPSNSGVLLHASGADKVWPRCIEAQLKAGSAGDFVLIGHTGITVGKKYQDDEKMYVSIPKKHGSNENSPGEWNSYDICCQGDAIMIYVNGLLQNAGRKATDTEGWICLQSEGSPIEFRNIYIEPLEPE